MKICVIKIQKISTANHDRTIRDRRDNIFTFFFLSIKKKNCRAIETMNTNMDNNSKLIFK